MNELIIYILKVIAIHGLLFLFYRIALRNTGRHAFNRGFLLIAVIAAFFIPLMEITIPEPVQASDEISVIMWLSEPTASMEEFELVPISNETTYSYWQLLPWLYALIALALMTRSIFYLYVLAKLKRHSEYVKKRWFKLFKISQDRPFSFFSNVFMPKSLFGTDAFDQILAHECEHVRRLHSIDRLLMDSVVSLFWFNPFIYLYRNALIEIHEFQADEVVLDRFKDPVGYQEILFSQLQTAQYSGLVSHFNFSMIKKRIVMMNKQRKTTGWVYALTVPVTLMVIFAFSSKEAMEPLNDVGDEIASIIGPEDGLNWSRLNLMEPTSDPIEPMGLTQENIPEILPLKSTDKVRMTSGFGMRMHPVQKVRKMHLGMDFACPIGTEVLATANGKVTGVKTMEGYGKLITVTHGDTYRTKYAQLSEFKVKEGDVVKKGDIIGLSGNSGMSTAPHLHYEVLKGEKRVDPKDYIKDYNFKASLEPNAIELAEQEMLLAQQQIELAEQARHEASEEERYAEEQMVLAEREAVLAEREREKSEEMREVTEEQAREKEVEERKLMELRVLNEKLKFDNSRQDQVIRFDGKKDSPLYVIDGEIVTEVSQLEPDEIDRIDVLKGKSAKEKYGKKGNNGVIEITTKNKQKNKSKNKSKSKKKDKTKNEQTAFRVLIDPGHGGNDPGSRALNGLEEKQITLEVAKVVSNYFTDRNDIEVIFTRDEDSFLSLQDRAAASKDADLLISIHANSDQDATKKYTGVFVDAQSAYLQESLEVSEFLGGQFKAIEREAKVGLVDDLYLIRTTDCPAILIEIGHLSNQSDLDYMTSYKGKEEIAASIANAIESVSTSW
ncbi:N-acetylmuramoyl-L-alanine amidase [Ekhidna sp. To15]|uniref:N-acetylmuramoyl-L-alanine amidase n=1 Tax=Ekhidna sp. To15 TaxID=3395267 RepID=UPI003F528716